VASGSTGYPATNDVFTIPSDPENTPLSSAGDGTRDLTQSIGDQGAAIMGLEGLTALKTHNHAGGADGTHILPQSSTHAVPDTDTALTSIHHTLGRGANQAAPGNLQLDYAASRPDILNRPYLICDSLDRPPSPFPGLMIFETDTNFLRIWADTGSGYAWQLIPFLQVPTVQLQQARPQALHTPGWIELLWDDIVDDRADHRRGCRSVRHQPGRPVRPGDRAQRRLGGVVRQQLAVLHPVQRLPARGELYSWLLPDRRGSRADPA